MCAALPISHFLLPCSVVTLCTVLGVKGKGDEGGGKTGGGGGGGINFGTYYRWDALTNVTQSSNSVSSWIDASNTVSAVQATTAKQPVLTANYINSMNSIVFLNSTDQVLTTGTMPASFINIKDITFFFVAKVTTGTGHFLSSSGTWVSGSMHLAMGTNLLIAVNSTKGTSYDNNNTSITIPMNTPFIIMINVFSTASSTSSYGRLNGVSTTAFVHNSTTALTLNTTAFDFGGWSAGGRTMTGGLSEVLMYNSTLTLTQIKSVESYLSTKWGIAVTA